MRTSRVKAKRVRRGNEPTAIRMMQKRVRAARPQSSVDEVLSLILESGGAVPVVGDRRNLVGIVSEHDLLAAIDDGRPPGAVKATDLMTANPYSVRPETTFGTLVHVMRASDLVRIPVVDAGDKFVGMLARQDVLKAYRVLRSSSKK